MHRHMLTWAVSLKKREKRIKHFAQGEEEKWNCILQRNCTFLEVSFHQVKMIAPFYHPHAYLASPGKYKMYKCKSFCLWTTWLSQAIPQIAFWKFPWGCSTDWVDQKHLFEKHIHSYILKYNYSSLISAMLLASLYFPRISFPKTNIFSSQYLY